MPTHGAAIVAVDSGRNGVVTLPDWMEQVRNWATTERQPPLAPKTLTDYMQDLNNYVRWTETTLEQPFTPALVTLENVENWKQHELDRKSVV